MSQISDSGSDNVQNDPRDMVIGATRAGRHDSGRLTGGARRPKKLFTTT
jgi:hypothetical protein